MERNETMLEEVNEEKKIVKCITNIQMLEKESQLGQLNVNRSAYQDCNRWGGERVKTKNYGY